MTLQHVFFHDVNASWVDLMATVETAINTYLPFDDQIVSISNWKESDGELIVLVWFYT